MFVPLKLKISASGFAPFEQAFNITVKRPEGSAAPSQGAMPSMANMPSFDKDFGKIKLTTDVKQLQGVTIVSNKPLVKFDGEKKVFNVEKNLVSAGGTAVDVMKNVPSVNVDIDGNVSLRNSPPQVFVG